jgi:hypothetical protein
MTMGPLLAFMGLMLGASDHVCGYAYGWLRRLLMVGRSGRSGIERR